MMRTLVVKCSFLLALVGPHGVASALDYDTSSDDWNGLSELTAVAISEGVELNETSTLDFVELASDPQPLVFVYPKSRIDVKSVTNFVLDGGRVVIFDDFGESEELLERLEVTRVVPSPGNLPHDVFLEDNPALPMFEPVGRHPLLEGVSTVVANHPAVVSNPGGPVVGYAAGGALVYDMNLGDGKVLVFADASLAINGMLRVADNRKLVGNALRYACEGLDGGQDCRPHLMVREFGQTGIYGSSDPFGSREDVADTVNAVNDAIARLLDELPAARLLYYLSILLGGGLAIYLVTVFPLRRTRAYSAYITDFFETIPEPQGEFDWNISRFGRGAKSMNYALPLSILKENFEEIFLRELGFWPSQPGERPDVRELTKIFSARYLGALEEHQRKKRSQSTLELLGVLAQIPPRSRVFLDSDAHFSEADLLRFHRLAMETLKIMGLDDDYKRRTRGAT